MTLYQASDSEILRKLKEIVLTNLEDESFGVDELVSQSGIGVNILRHRLKMLTHKTIHQYIHEIRLNKAAELLRGNSLTVSEVAWKTGFGSPEYFIRCYHDYFGYSPGFDMKRETQNLKADDKDKLGDLPLTRRKPDPEDPKKRRTFLLLLSMILLGILGIPGFFFLVVPNLTAQPEKQSINIALLPFENETPDSNNVYFFNRLTDMISENLSSNGNFAVTPRRTVEYLLFNNFKTSRQIAKELKVDYLVDGRGQKNGNDVLLTVQLIDTKTDKNTFSLPFEGKNDDERILCISLAKMIAAQIILTVNNKSKRKSPL